MRPDRPGHHGWLTFTGISQDWLREAAKGGAAHDLPRRRGKQAGARLNEVSGALVRLSATLRAGRPDQGENPAQTRDHQRDRPRRAGRTRRTLSHTRTPPTPPRRHQPGTSAQPRAHGACLSRLPEKRARPVLTGPRRRNAPGLPEEIFFSVIQKKAVTPNDFASLSELSATLLSLVDRYNQTARPFSWKFTAADRHDLMDRITSHEQQDTSQDERLPDAA